MGWCRDDAPGHEGYLVGFVDAGRIKGSGIYRELGYPADAKNLDQVDALSAACDCGWRSPRWPARVGTLWGPFSVLAAEDDQEKARELWKEHIARGGRS